MKSETYNYIIITVIIVMLSYALGLIIVQTVDHRLSNISINMPEIKVPRANVVVKMGNNMKTVTATSSADQLYYQVRPKNKGIRITQTGGAASKLCNKSEPRHFDSKAYKSESAKATAPAKTNPTEDAIVHSLPATYPHKSEAVNTRDIEEGDGTHYKDPAEMTPEQQVKFKNKAKYSKMTLRDYQNWLRLFTDDPHNLSQSDRKNLRRVDSLTVDDIPKTPIPDAQQNYDKLLHTTHKLSPDITQPSDVLAANSFDFDQFMPSKRLKHMTHFNPDEDLKFKSPFLDCIKLSMSRR